MIADKSRRAVLVYALLAVTTIALHRVHHRMREDGPWVSFALRFAFRTPTTSSPPIGWNPLKLADLGGRSSSIIVAGQAQGAKVVKTFNSLTMANFEKGPTEGNGRRVLFVSGDDRSAKQLVSDLITSFGYAVIDLGDLDEGGRFRQPGGPLAGKDLLLAS